MKDLHVPLPSFKDLIDGVNDLRRTSEAMQEHGCRIFTQYTGITVRSLTDPNETSYSTLAQNILGESSQRSQPAGNMNIFSPSNSQIQGERVGISDTRQYIRLRVSNILFFKGEFDRDIVL